MGIIDIGIFSNLFFNGYVFTKEPFEFYLTYIPIVILLPIFFIKYKFPKELLYILLPLLITGLLNVFLENDTFRNFFKIFANIAVNIIFYRYVLEYYEFDVSKIFRMYLVGCFFVAVLGLMQLGFYFINIKPGYDWHLWLPLNKWSVNPGGLGIRINSTFSEPANLGLTFSPAFFVSVHSLINNTEKFITRWRAIVIIVVYILSFSSLAYIGIFLTILLLAINFGLIRYLFIAIPVAIVFFNIAYTQAPEFKSRVDGVQSLFIDNILEKGVPSHENGTAKIMRIRKILLRTQGSSFVFYNNVHIAVENFKRNPLFGSGLGSQELAFDLYNLNDIIGGIYKFNASDANSMFLRIMSELGIMGILFAILFIGKSYISKNLSYNEEDEYWLISNALLVLILAQMLRQGNYTFGGFFLFAWLYYYNRVNYVSYKNSTASLK